MKIGVPKEIKAQESRVAIVPAGVRELVKDGNIVMVERGAGVEAGFSDGDYAAMGARVLDSAADVYSASDMIYKVKEPLPSEYSLIRAGQILFTYFHFAAAPDLTRAMQKSGALCIAYETLEMPDGTLPLLIPMSEIAGRMAPQTGANALEKHHGGSGVLLGGVPGVKPAKVTILGGGVSGANAALIAAGMGAQVTILDINLPRLRHLADIMPSNVVTLHSGSQVIADACAESDLVIGAVLIHGAPAPKLITRDILRTMRKGSVFVDVAVDQGGCSETTRPTTHRDPTYIEEGVVHYAVANIPGAVGRTSTFALTNATLPFARKISRKGISIIEDSVVKSAVNIYEGEIRYPALQSIYS
jgi:alanine dehydrogenase